jgi:hydroxyethylthiazole kinase-like uncharacterized protein yjeF
VATAIISISQMREWEEASWRAGKKQAEVIQNVGRILAERILALTREEERVLVLAGKGQNGDDARAAIPHLLKRKVKLFDVVDPKEALAQLPHLLAKRPRLIVDALFGIGINRALSEDWVRLIEAINASGIFVLAVDVPSGLNAESGKPEGAAICADLTLTVGAVKRGLLNAEETGRLELAPEIGLTPCPFKTELVWTEERDFEDFPPRRRANTHKGSYGHVGIIAGSLGYHGAAVLAARGAQRARPGLIYLFAQPEIYVPVASQLQSVMVHPWPPHIRLEENCSALVVGPGLAAHSLAADLKQRVREWWKTFPKPMLVDASALEWLEAGGEPKFCRVITPHPGEAGRLLGCSSAEVQADRVGAVRKLSERFGNCWVVLKGNRTLIGRATGEVYVNSSGNPFLAQGGSGDLLAGFIGGFLAQPRIDPLMAIRFAVWNHGAAADGLVGSWTVEDLASAIG